MAGLLSVGIEVVTQNLLFLQCEIIWLEWRKLMLRVVRVGELEWITEQL